MNFESIKRCVFAGLNLIVVLAAVWAAVQAQEPKTPQLSAAPMRAISEDERNQLKETKMARRAFDEQSNCLSSIWNVQKRSHRSKSMTRFD